MVKIRQTVSFVGCNKPPVRIFRTHLSHEDPAISLPPYLVRVALNDLSGRVPDSTGQLTDKPNGDLGFPCRLVKCSIHKCKLADPNKFRVYGQTLVLTLTNHVNECLVNLITKKRRDAVNVTPLKRHENHLIRASGSLKEFTDGEFRLDQLHLSQSISRVGALPDVVRYVIVHVILDHLKLRRYGLRVPRDWNRWSFKSIPGAQNAAQTQDQENRNTSKNQKLNGNAAHMNPFPGQVAIIECSTYVGITEGQVHRKPFANSEDIMWLFVIFAGTSLIEIALFIVVGNRIGLWPTLGIIVLTAAIGTWLVRAQGLTTIRWLRETLSELGNPSEPLAHGAMILVAGALLLTPGFFTDGIGFALLMPPVRSAVFRHLSQRFRGVLHNGPNAPERRTKDPFADTVDTGFRDVPPSTARPGGSGWTRR